MGPLGQPIACVMHGMDRAFKIEDKIKKKMCSRCKKWKISFA